MTVALPAVTQTIRDNATGNIDLSAIGVVAVMGCCSAGTADTPQAFQGSFQNLVTAFGRGPGVQLGALILQAGGKIVFNRVTSATAGARATIDVTGVTGTSVVTSSGAPYDTYQIVFTVTTGGTIGTAGIKFTYSVDNGRTTSGVYSLGTATSFLVPNTNTTLLFAAGTLVAGDIVRQTTTEPLHDNTGIASAIVALGANSTKWEMLACAGVVSASNAGQINTSLTTLFNAVKYVTALSGARMPAVAESDATYQASVITDFASTASVRQLTTGGAAVVTSPVDGSQYLRSALYAMAPRAAAVRPGVDLAQVDLGPLAQVSLYDSLGNQVTRTHNEQDQPGLNDANFATLRTIPTKGRLVYVANPLLMSAANSDFTLLQHSRCMNIAADTAYQVLVAQLSRGVRVVKSGVRAGMIIEKDALKIEALCRSALKAALVDTGDVTDAFVTVSRDDLILTTRTLTSTTYVIPLAYVKTIANTLQFLNPALTATVV